jgi:WD40 repeat protein
MLVVGASDGTIAVWDLVDRQVLGVPLRAHRSKVKSLAFGRDGRFFLSAAGDGPATYWTVAVDDWSALASRMAGRNFTKDEWQRFVGSDTAYRRTFQQWPAGQ